MNERPIIVIGVGVENLKFFFKKKDEDEEEEDEAEDDLYLRLFQRQREDQSFDGRRFGKCLSVQLHLEAFKKIELEEKEKQMILQKETRKNWNFIKQQTIQLGNKNVQHSLKLKKGHPKKTKPFR